MGGTYFFILISDTLKKNLAAPGLSRDMREARGLLWLSFPVACGVLVLQPGIKPVSPHWKADS